MKIPVRFVSKMNRLVLANGKAPGADCSASSKANLSGPKSVAKGKARICDAASTCTYKNNYARTCMGRSANPAEEFISMALESFSSNVATL